MDGVLLNSLVEDESWKFNAVKDALEKLDVESKKVSKDDMEKFLGDHGRKECIATCEEYNLDPEKVWKLIAEETNLARIEWIKSRGFRLYPDARSFLEMIHPRNVELGLISNAPEMAVESTMKFFNLKSYFRFYRGVESFEDLKLRKPHPDHIEMAKAELKRKPYLYIGDAESDIKAAKNAGVDSALIDRDGSKENVEATYKVKDLRELGRKLNLI